MRALAACFLIPIIGFCSIGPAWLLFHSRSGSSSGFGIVLLVLGLAIAVLFTGLLLAAFRACLEILPDGVLYTKGWGQLEGLHIDEIAGYRIVRGRNSRSVVFIPKATTLKPIKVELMFERRAELMALLEAKFHNLDQDDFQAEMNEIKADENLGFSEEQRLATLGHARTQANALNLASVVLLFWGMFYPRPYDLIMILLALMPLLAVGLVKWSRGVVTLDGKQTGARPNVASAIIAPGLILALRALFDWHILEWSRFWTPFALFGGAFMVLVWYASPSAGRRPAGSLLALSLFCLAYSYGLMIYLNCTFDHSVPALHRAVVQSRRISQGRHTSYYLTVSPWLNEPGAKEIDVGSAIYGRHPEGSRVQIAVHPGSLAIPWFGVR